MPAAGMKSADFKQSSRDKASASHCVTMPALTPNAWDGERLEVRSLGRQCFGFGWRKSRAWAFWACRSPKAQNHPPPPHPTPTLNPPKSSESGWSYTRGYAPHSNYVPRSAETGHLLLCNWLVLWAWDRTWDIQNLWQAPPCHGYLRSRRCPSSTHTHTETCLESSLLPITGLTTSHALRKQVTCCCAIGLFSELGTGRVTYRICGKLHLAMDIWGLVDAFNTTTFLLTVRLILTGSFRV